MKVTKQQRIQKNSLHLGAWQKTKYPNTTDRLNISNKNKTNYNIISTQTCYYFLDVQTAEKERRFFQRDINQLGTELGAKKNIVFTQPKSRF